MKRDRYVSSGGKGKDLMGKVRRGGVRCVKNTGSQKQGRERGERGRERERGIGNF